MKKHLISAAAGITLLLAATPASALSLEEAGVEKGEVEVQYEATYTDKNAEGAYEHEQEMEVQFGLLDWLLLTVGFGFEEEEGERDFEFSEIEGEVQIELIDPEKGGFGLALLAGLSKEMAAEDDEADEKQFKFGVIAEQHFADKWLVRGNLFYITDIDAAADEQYDGIEYAYQVKYSVSEKLGIGVEGYGSHQEFDDPGEDDVDQHMVGPVLYYSFERGGDDVRHASIKDIGKGEEGDDDEEEGTEFELQAGVLFGTTDDTADVTFKWGLEIEF